MGVIFSCAVGCYFQGVWALFPSHSETRVLMSVNSGWFRIDVKLIKATLALTRRVLLLPGEAERQKGSFPPSSESSLIISLAYHWQWGGAWMPWMLMSQIVTSVSAHTRPRRLKQKLKQCCRDSMHIQLKECRAGFTLPAVVPNLCCHIYRHSAVRRTHHHCFLNHSFINISYFNFYLVV